MGSFNITSYCKIANGKVNLNGNELFVCESVEVKDFVKQAYKHFNIAYPKFFKMDTLSKLAFLTADILLQNENLSLDKEHNIAVVFSNASSSLDTDRKHQESIQDKNNYYPSPAIFVYTLPNICVGEISIKHKLYSENSFFIFESFNEAHLESYSNALLIEKKATQVLCGWVEVDNGNYEAFVYLVSPTGVIEHTSKNIKKLYND